MEVISLMFCMFLHVSDDCCAKKMRIRVRAGRFRAGYDSDLLLFSFAVVYSIHIHLPNSIQRISVILYLYYIPHKSRISRSIYLPLSHPKESAMHPYPSLGSRHSLANTNG